ncbi:MAG: purine-nucleoside phosphorylase [Bryobacterales bacterium]|nr:purine-nucleoside phosphorylase [Bryobacterales bacterium]
MAQWEQLEEARRVVESKTSRKPRIGVVLGSGLGEFARRLHDADRIPYHTIPGFPIPSAEGHAGELILGEVSGVEVACMAGRVHQYEGYSAQDVVFGVRLLGMLGVTTLILTNAAGGLDPSYERGELVLIKDHINFQGTNPLIGANLDALGPRFPDMTEAYSGVLRRIAKEVARSINLRLAEGVYMALLGPSFETPAEIRAFRTLGADLVGMSTVPEVIAANHMGMACLGISCVTNAAAGLSEEKLSHQEVLDTGRAVQAKFEAFLEALLPRLA